MTAARQDDLVRITAAAASLFDGRTIPAGRQGVVLENEPDGACLVEVTITPQTEDHNGDFTIAIPTQGQHEVISS